MDNFLPKDYERPTSEGGYMKFQKGENVFRILSSPILGWEAWHETTEKKTPMRFRLDNKPTDLRPYKEQRIKHFWAMVVWNYNEKRVQILSITQATIIKDIEQHARDKDWGDPREYDLKVTRTGDNLETEYSIMAKPKVPVSSEIQKAFESSKINLEKLFSNQDPFNVDEAKTDDLEHLVYRNPLDPTPKHQDDENINPDDIPF